MAFLKSKGGIHRKALINYHCIIHQENLFTKTFRFDAVMKVVKDVVKFIQTKALIHRQFQDFLTAKCEADQDNVIYYCDVC